MKMIRYQNLLKLGIAASALHMAGLFSQEDHAVYQTNFYHDEVVPQPWYSSDFSQDTEEFSPQSEWGVMQNPSDWEEDPFALNQDPNSPDVSSPNPQSDQEGIGAEGNSPLNSSSFSQNNVRDDSSSTPSSSTSSSIPGSQISPSPSPVAPSTLPSSPPQPSSLNQPQSQTPVQPPNRAQTPSTPSTAETRSPASVIHQPAPVPTSASIPFTTPPIPNSERPTPFAKPKEISVNFNNVSMIEYLRFMSRISNKNFIFDDEDIQFNVTIISEEPTTIENLMSALLQELQIRDLSLIEQGNNIIIHKNARVRSPARVVVGGPEMDSSHLSEMVTRVFRLNTLDPIKASEIIRPLLSDSALIEVLKDTNNLIITDLVANVNKISQLIQSLDAPNSGVNIGQYVVRNAFVTSLVELAGQILQPIAQGNPFTLVPHSASNSIFIVSNPFIVEKALAILQNLDMNEGRTKILSLESLRPNPAEDEGDRRGSSPSFRNGPGAIDENGFPLRDQDAGGFEPGIVEEHPFFDESRDFLPGSVGAPSRWAQEIPMGHIERTLFFIYKLRYRKGDQIEVALRKIAMSLQMTGTTNADLITAINSAQWIESSNALIFTGAVHALDKIKELMLEVDVPMRQVFIEMLILDTSVTDSLAYSVDWISRFGGGNVTGEEGFRAPGGTNLLGNITETLSLAANPLYPVATGILSLGGFDAGVIGTHLTHNGTRFNSIGALVRAIHSDRKANILLNPKIITEDNNPAEIFVGGTDRYKTQSITNDLGVLVTNNFQFIDVGTTLRVTPLIGNNGIITLEIIQETTNPSPEANATPNQQNVDVNLVEVLTKTRTVTKIHVPNGFFVILSGMIHDNEIREYDRIPCLGGVPILGAFGKNQRTADIKRNLMLFIRPLILDTDEDMEDITKRQQDVYREKSKFRRSWNYEVDEGLNYLNIKPTDPDERGCPR